MVIYLSFAASNYQRQIKRKKKEKIAPTAIERVGLFPTNINYLLLINILLKIQWRNFLLLTLDISPVE